jgi:hypothetical protein
VLRIQLPFGYVPLVSVDPSGLRRRIRLGQQLPEVNVVVFAVVVLTIIPVAISVRLAGRAGIR